MALHQVTLTMTGSAVQASATSVPFSYMRIENEASNAIVKYGLSTVTSTDYAGSVLADTTTINNSVIIGPMPQPGCMNLLEFYFLGTNSQKIHLTVITN